jgi:hypothetical protein
MRSCIAFVLLSLTLSAAAPRSKPNNDLYIYVSLTRAERSKDSNSRRTTITLDGRKIVYEKVYQGYGRNKREPVHKEFTIKDEDVLRLGKLVRDHDLLVSNSLKHTGAGGGGFVSFEISLDVRAGGKRSHIEISWTGKAAGIKEEKLYTDARALLEEIFRILDAQDEELGGEGKLVIDAP